MLSAFCSDAGETGTDPRSAILVDNAESAIFLIAFGGGLATAGLSLRNIDLYAEVSKQPHSVRAGIRIELVGETRCKEGDLHASEPGPGTQGVRRKRCDVRRGGSIHDFKDSRVPSVVGKSVALIA